MKRCFRTFFFLGYEGNFAPGLLLVEVSYDVMSAGIIIFEQCVFLCYVMICVRIGEAGVERLSKNARRWVEKAHFVCSQKQTETSF